MARKAGRLLLAAAAVAVMMLMLSAPASAQVDDDDYTPPAEVAPVVVERGPAVRGVTVARTGTDAVEYVRIGFAAIVLGGGLVLLARSGRRHTLPANTV